MVPGMNSIGVIKKKREISESEMTLDWQTSKIRDNSSSSSRTVAEARFGATAC